jgi:hypothetical protein
MAELPSHKQMFLLINSHDVSAQAGHHQAPDDGLPGPKHLFE